MIWIQHYNQNLPSGDFKTEKYNPFLIFYWPRISPAVFWTGWKEIAAVKGTGKAWATNRKEGLEAAVNIKAPHTSIKRFWKDRSLLAWISFGAGIEFDNRTYPENGLAVFVHVICRSGLQTPFLSSISGSRLLRLSNGDICFALTDGNRDIVFF